MPPLAGDERSVEKILEIHRPHLAATFATQSVKFRACFTSTCESSLLLSDTFYVDYRIAPCVIFHLFHQSCPAVDLGLEFKSV